MDTIILGMYEVVKDNERFMNESYRKNAKVTKLYKKYRTERIIFLSGIHLKKRI